MYKGSQRNFRGMIINVKGPDNILEKMIEEMEYTSGAEILSRREVETGGILVIQAAKFAAPNVCRTAKKLNLSVVR